MICIVKTTSFYDESAKDFHGVQVAERFRKLVERNPEYEPTRLQCCIEGNYCLRRFANKQAIFTYDEREVNGKNTRYYLGLTVMKVGSIDFERFQSRGISALERDKLTGRDLVDWDKLWREYVDNPEQECVHLPEMSDAERAFVVRDKGYVKQIFDYPIYETRQWVEKISSKDFGDPFKVAQALEKKIYEVECECSDKEIIDLEVQYGTDGDNNPNNVLLYRMPRPDGVYGWFLIALGGREDLDDARAQLKDVLAVPSYDALAQVSRRAYPLDMLSDKDRWKDMEVAKDSNLILSDEEIRLVSSKLDFPLFVTGRAGSGKSTMLQYLFADYFLRYLETGIGYPPVYLSYSENLVKNAKSLASILFEKNHTFVEELKKLGLKYSDDVEPRLEVSFKRFEDVVREHIRMVAPDVVSPQGRFATDRHVSYSDFRLRWMNRFGKEPRAAGKYGPELSWHVIRSYIKGWDSESFCEPSDYAASSFGRRNKSVSDEVFSLIYDRVWSWYRELQENEGLWDDQDLVRYCLTPDDDRAETCVNARYSAIFCDESQDFTRIETELIIRLSIYSSRRIGDSVGRLPFVFAGDEFQTLNPTGFSWASLRSYFAERLSAMTRCEKAFSAPEPQVLKRNYRSTVPVVKLANRIQLLRYSRCGGDGKIEPQVPHYAENKGDSVYCLNAKDPMVWENLRSLGACLIIPSADGQSAKEFLDRSPIKGMVDFYVDGSAKNITIYNPVTAKGLEYPIVAVYGFDGNDVLPPELQPDKLLRWGEGSEVVDSDARGIALKYFLSNAYVSATRAKRKLFILTDRPARESFWSFALSSGDSVLSSKISRLEEKMLSSLKNVESWDRKQMLGWIVEGSISDLGSLGKGEVVTAREAAEETMKQGLALHDPGLLRQAAARFREQGDAKGTAKCEGYAYYYETHDEKSTGTQHYQQAGQKFDEAGENDLAFMSYWRACRSRDGSDVDDMLKKLAESKSAKYTLLVSFARELLSSPVSIRMAIRLLDGWIKILRGRNDEAELSLIRQDTVATKTLLDILIGRLPSRLSGDERELYALFLDKLSILEQQGLGYSKDKCAEQAFNSGLYDRAIAFWEDGIPESRRPKGYYVAKTRVVSYPDNLRYFEKTGREDWKAEVLRQYHKDIQIAEKEGRRPAALEGQNKNIVKTSLFELGSEAEATQAFPYLLSLKGTREECQKFLDEAVGVRGVKCFKVAFESVLDIKFNVRISRRISFRTPTEDSYQLMRVLNKVVEVRTPEFRQKVDEAIRDKRYVSSIMNEFIGEFTFNKWHDLLLVEVGRLMERRGYFVDAIRYYEWARNQTSDVGFKRKMDVRWIVCKERHAEHSDGTDASNEAIQKRNELGIPLNEVLHQELEMDWVSFFSLMMEIPPERHQKQEPVSLPTEKALAPVNADVSELQVLAQKKVSAEEKVPNKETAASISSQGLDVESITVNDATPVLDSAPKQDGTVKTQLDIKERRFFDYPIMDGYKFRYKYGVQLLIDHQTDTEDWRIKFTKCEMPSGCEFHLEGDRLVLEDGGQTPFAIRFEKDGVHVELIESGVVMVFPLSSKQ